MAFTYHLERSEGAQVVSALAVGPGAPARVLPFLQHKLLPSEARELIPDPPGGKHRETTGSKQNMWVNNMQQSHGQSGKAVMWLNKHTFIQKRQFHRDYSRATLYDDGANPLRLFDHILAFSRQFHLLSDEVLKLESHQLQARSRCYWDCVESHNDESFSCYFSALVRSHCLNRTLYVTPAPPWPFPAACWSGIP